MLEKPALPDEMILAQLGEGYGFAFSSLEFLPIGNDATSWVYRAQAANADYFLKVKRGTIDPPALLVPRYLKDNGMAQAVAPLPTQDGSLWKEVDDFNLILYPFIEGKSGMEVGLSETQWISLGHILKQLHTTQLPEALARQVKHETLVPMWGAMVEKLDLLIGESTQFDTTYANELAQFWRGRRDEIRRITTRTTALGQQLQQQTQEFVLCHADIHTANVLVSPDGTLHIVDWDQPIFAPKERDLMFMVENPEVDFFMQGYGQTVIDPVGLAYYRYEWVVQEIGDYGERVFLSADSGEETLDDSVRGFRQLFAAGDVVDGAYEAEKLMGF